MILQLNYKKIILYYIYIYVCVCVLVEKNSKLKVDSKKSKNLEWPSNLYIGLVLVATIPKKSFVLTKQEKISYKKLLLKRMQMNCELWYVGCLLSWDPKLIAWDY